MRVGIIKRKYTIFFYIRNKFISNFIANRAVKGTINQLFLFFSRIDYSLFQSVLLGFNKNS